MNSARSAEASVETPIPHPSVVMSARQIGRFWSRVVAMAEDECWLWKGRTTHKGYGLIDITSNWVTWHFRAHRVAYELSYGPIADGLVLHHLCRNRLCVNPAHLQPVSNRENVLCGVGISAVHARQTHCVHGHELSGDNVRKDIHSEEGGVMSLTLEPQRVDENCWYYEEPDGIHVVAREPDVVTLIRIIPWPMIARSLARKQNRKLPRKARAAVPHGSQEGS